MRRIDHINEEIFEGTQFTDGLDAEECKLLTKMTERRLYEPDEVVVKEGEKTRDVFALKSGRAEVTKLDDGANQRKLAELEPGSVFGEIALALGTPRSATVRALEDSELLCIDGGALQTLRNSGKIVAYKVEHNIFRMLAERQAQLNSELLELMDDPDDSQFQRKPSHIRKRLLEKWTF